MINKPDSLFGIHAAALELWQKRAEVLASNLTNADTPGYLARDVDFRSVLANSEGATNSKSQLPLTETAGAHLQATAHTGGNGYALKYRIPLQPAVDGNTVDSQAEQAAFADNSVRYQASLSFISAQIHLMRVALNGTS